jgi:ankyrin repeat protein
MTLKTLLSSIAVSALLAGSAMAKNALMDEDFFSDETTVALVQAELDKGATLTERGKFGENPLHFALMGHAPVEVIKQLVEAGAPLNQPAGNKGDVAMLRAVAYGDLELLKYLKSKGGDFTAMDDEGKGALFYLTGTKHFDPAVLAFLQAQGGVGNDPLHQSSMGETVAMRAARSEADNAIELLDTFVALGSDPSVMDAEGRDGFMISASRSKNYALVDRFAAVSEDLMARNIEGRDALLMGARRMDGERYDYMIAKGFDPMAVDNAGANALMIASERAKPEVLQLWLDHGLDVNATDTAGNTALMAAIIGNSVEASQFLLDKGADPLATNAKGQTVLLKALSRGIKDPASEDGIAMMGIIDALIAKGGDLKAVDANGATALFYAVRAGQPIDLMREIIAAGADVNAVDRDGNTALMLAVLGASDPAVIEVLVKAGADVSVKDVFDDGLVAMASDNPALKDSPVLALLQ